MEASNDTPRYSGRTLDDQEFDQELRDREWDRVDEFWDRVDRLVDYGGSVGAAVEMAEREEKAA